MIGAKRGRPYGQSDFLEADELQRLVRLPDRRTKDGLRDHALLVLMVNTGLRKGEITMLRRGNLVERGAQRFLHYVVEKKRKVMGQDRENHRLVENTIPLRQETCDAILRYHESEFKGERDNSDNPLFMTLGKHGGNGKRSITPKAIDCLVKKYAKMAGFGKRITPHSFRASCATHLLEQGVDLKTVSELLGHASVVSTQPYLRSNIERKRKAVEHLAFV